MLFHRMLLCAIKLVAQRPGLAARWPGLLVGWPRWAARWPGRARRLGVSLGLVILGGVAGTLAPSPYTLAPALHAQQIPQLPSNMTPEQLQQLLQQPGLADQLRQRIDQSGLTPDEIRARLRAAGYPESAVDAYLGPADAGQQLPAPTAQTLRAASALGLGRLRHSRRTR